MWLEMSRTALGGDQRARHGEANRSLDFGVAVVRRISLLERYTHVDNILLSCRIASFAMGCPKLQTVSGANTSAIRTTRCPYHLDKRGVQWPTPLPRNRRVKAPSSASAPAWPLLPPPPLWGAPRNRRHHNGYVGERSRVGTETKLTSYGVCFGPGFRRRCRFAFTGRS